MIISKDNPKIKHYKKLCSSNSFSLESKQMVLEGLRLCMELSKCSLNVDCFFYTEKFKNKFFDEFSFLSKLSNFSDEISDNISEYISNTHNPQGCFVICKLPENNSSFIKESNKLLLLDNISDPGNMGNIIRTSEALGIDGILSFKGCFVYSDKVIRSSMGSILRLPIYTFDDLDFINTLKNNNFNIVSSVLKNYDCTIGSFQFPQKCVLVLGNEANGINIDILQISDIKLTIPMKGLNESFNVSSAACILLWEMMK